MEIAGKLTVQDLRSAMWLHIAPRRSIAILGIVVLALCAWALWIMFFGSRPSSGWDKWGLVVVLLYLLAYFGLYVPYRISKAYRQRKALQRDFTFSPSEDGIRVTMENVNAMIPWSDLLKWKEDKRIFLLYVADELYHPIPKRLFTRTTDVETFRAMLREHVGNK